jgi:MmyB-like transcription regulator ligand binding domain
MCTDDTPAGHVHPSSPLLHDFEPSVTLAGRDPCDGGLSDLVGELSTRSEASRTRWAAHNVLFHHTGVKHLHHPVVGDLTLNYQTRRDRSAPETLAPVTVVLTACPA